MKQYFLAALEQRTYLRLIIVASLCFITVGSALVLLKPSLVAHAQSSRLAIGAETLVYDHNTLVNKGLSGWTDSPIGCLSAGNGNIDCYSSNGGAYQSDATTKTSGTTTDPAQTVVYNHVAITNEPGGVYNYASISSIYKDPSSGTLIGFVHLERDPKNGWQYFWASIGLAYSKDNGASWNWGGEIIQHNIPYDPNYPPNGYEAGVGAYILYTDNGTQYFYVYMDDTNADGTGGVSVSRAPVQQVLNAVNNGTSLPTFYKYDNGGWSSQASWINGTGGTPQGGHMTDVSGGNGAIDSIIWDGALGQYVAGIRAYDQGYWTVDLVTSGNPLDFSTAHGAIHYEIVSPTQAVYPTLIGDPTNPQLQANTDGSFYLYYATLATGQSFNFNNTGLGRRLVTVTTANVSTSYQASSDFSGTQGQDQWSYTYSTDGEQYFPAMNWDGGNNRWQGSEAYCQIASNWQHPGGGSCDSVRLWQAPVAGTVTIGANGNLSVTASCSSNPGVNIRILKNGSQIWPASGWQLLAHGSSYTFPSGITTTVNAGDELQFVVAHAGSDNYCDTTGWDQTVVYGGSTSYQASNNFSGTQGQNQWSYEQSGNGEQSLQAMNWDGSNNRWQGSEQYCLIGSNWQHPGGSCDSVRVWQASAGGTVTIGANGNLYLAASCSNNPGVNIRILKNASQIWPSSGWQLLTHGASYTFPSGVTTSVNSGDQLQFVVAHAGSDNYCDTTVWDQVVTYS